MGDKRRAVSEPTRTETAGGVAATGTSRPVAVASGGFKDQTEIGRSRAQRVPACGAARVQDFATRFGCQACTETVAVLANEVRRLVSAFAHREPPCGYGRKIEEIRGPNQF